MSDIAETVLNLGRQVPRFVGLAHPSLKNCNDSTHPDSLLSIGLCARSRTKAASGDLYVREEEEAKEAKY